VTSAVLSVSYGAEKDKVYVGRLGIIGLTTCGVAAVMQVDESVLTTTQHYLFCSVEPLIHFTSYVDQFNTVSD